MADSPIAGKGITVKQLFKDASFALDYYQREYTWTKDEVSILIEDLSRRFHSQWSPTHEREDVDSYAPYFLGPYVYHESNGRTFLVDGQQRITTLHLLLIYLHRLLADQELDVDADEVKNLIYTSRHGKRHFTIDAPEEPSRSKLLEALFKDWEGLNGFSLPDGCSVSVRNIYDRSREIDECFPDTLRDEVLPLFVQWLLDRVCLVGIRALNQENAREIFVSMNDRGLRPNPVDLLKSHVFGKLDRRNPADLRKAWADMLSALTAVANETGDPNAASTFVRSFLLARYARHEEGSDDVPSIERAFHDWVADNEKPLGIDRSAGARLFIEQMTKIAVRYCTLLTARKTFQPELASVFYNDYNGIDNQLCLLLAAVSLDEPERETFTKCELVARFLDLVYVRRVVNNLPVQRSDMDEVIYTTIPLLRDCRTADEIAAALGQQIAQLDQLGMDFGELRTFGLRGNNYRMVRYLLARMTGHIQRECDKEDREGEYLRGDQKYEVEHIWADKFDRYKTITRTYAEFDSYRNRLGALLLLPKSMNASFRDDPYEKKLDHYFAQNRLAASLHPKSRERNPRFRDYIKRAKLEAEFRPCPTFGKKEIELRQELYQRLCEEIWDPARLGFLVPKLPKTVEQTIRKRTRAHYGVELADLIKAGLLQPGVKIFRTVKDTTHYATIESDGTVRLETGEPFHSLSAAGAAVSKRKACAGWDFWRTERNGQIVPLKEIRKEALLQSST